MNTKEKSAVSAGTLNDAKRSNQQEALQSQSSNKTPRMYHLIAEVTDDGVRTYCSRFIPTHRKINAKTADLAPQQLCPQCQDINDLEQAFKRQDRQFLREVLAEYLHRKIEGELSD